MGAEFALTPGLLGPHEIRQLAAAFGVTPTKKLGQNFVHDPNTVRKIVRLAGVSAGQHVLEIGPGLGSLTLGILEADAAVTAIEIDARLAGALKNTASQKQPEKPLVVVNKDALLLGLDDFEAGVFADNKVSFLPETLVANLPYNVSVPILMHLLELLPSLKKGLVMVQAEVGARIVAKPGSKEYGSPSAKAAWYGDWELASKVSRQIFWPVPGVDSVLVSYEKHGFPLGSEQQRERTFELINSAFANRRKMLRQSLQPVLGNIAETTNVLEAAGVDPTARAENLGVADFLLIAKASQ